MKKYCKNCHRAKLERAEDIPNNQNIQQASKVAILLNKCGDDDAKRRALLNHITKNGFSALHICIYKVSALIL